MDDDRRSHRCRHHIATIAALYTQKNRKITDDRSLLPRLTNNYSEPYKIETRLHTFTQKHQKFTTRLCTKFRTK